MPSLLFLRFRLHPKQHKNTNKKIKPPKIRIVGKITIEIMIGKNNIGIMTHSTIATVDIEVLVISAIDLIESVMNSATIFDSVHI